MVPAWCLELSDRILRADLSDGIHPSDCERLYTCILQHVEASMEY
jgi:hypothetical protein